MSHSHDRTAGPGQNTEASFDWEQEGVVESNWEARTSYREALEDISVVNVETRTDSDSAVLRVAHPEEVSDSNGMFKIVIAPMG